MQNNFQAVFMITIVGGGESISTPNLNTVHLGTVIKPNSYRAYNLQPPVPKKDIKNPKIE